MHFRPILRAVCAQFHLPLDSTKNARRRPSQNYLHAIVGLLPVGLEVEPPSNGAILADSKSLPYHILDSLAAKRCVIKLVMDAAVSVLSIDSNVVSRQSRRRIRDINIALQLNIIFTELSPNCSVKIGKGARNSYIGLHWAFWGKIIPQGIFVRLATVYIHLSLWPKHLTNCKY